MLFYGLLMLNVTVFIAGYFISFALLAAIFTVFLGPTSSSIAVYFSLLFILLTSTLIAYGLTKLISISIVFIGACKPFFILSLWINSWSLIQYLIFLNILNLFSMVISYFLSIIYYSIWITHLSISQLYHHNLIKSHWIIYAH